MQMIDNRQTLSKSESNEQLKTKSNFLSNFYKDLNMIESSKAMLEREKICNQFNFMN